jgi:hypothetical protein
VVKLSFASVNLPAAYDPTQALARRSDIPNSSRFLCIGQRAFYVAEIVSAARALQRYL